MKKIITLMVLAVMIQKASCQNELFNDAYFNKAIYENAKINNEDASKFFLKFPYNNTITNSDGNVLVSFIVRKDGEIDSVQVLNDPGTLWKETALDALNHSSGHWNPARFDDRQFEKKYFASFNFTKSSIFFYKKNKALKLLQTGQTTRTLKLINEALSINPFDIDLLLWRARIYKKQNKRYLELIDLLMAEKVRTDVLFNLWF